MIEGKRLAVMAGLAATCALGGCAVRPTTIGASPALSASPPACAARAEANRALVLAFYDEGLVRRQPIAAFERYMAADFVEHKPDVPEGTRGATARFLADLMEDVPQGRWEILRTVAEGDMVFLHARMIPAPGAPAYAIADLFRVRDCRIAEHWDVVAGPAADAPNPNSRF